MTTLFKNAKCPRCKEDYLLVTLNKKSNELYLSCSECEASWLHPDDVADPHKMFVDLSIAAEDPSYSDLERAGWLKYVTGTIEN